MKEEYLLSEYFVLFFCYTDFEVLAYCCVAPLLFEMTKTEIEMTANNDDYIPIIF